MQHILLPQPLLDMPLLEVSLFVDLSLIPIIVTFCLHIHVPFLSLCVSHLQIKTNSVA
jgi:hypothetical protein